MAFANGYLSVISVRRDLPRLGRALSLAALLAPALFAGAGLGAQEASAGPAGAPDAWTGRLFFVNFPTERVVFLEDGQFKSDAFPHLPMSVRGVTDAQVAGAAFGLLGLVALPAIHEERADSLFLEEAVRGLAVLPDGRRILFTNPRGSSDARLVGVDGRTLDRLPFRGSDPDLSADGSRVLLAEGSLEKGKLKLAEFELATGKRTAFHIPGSESQYCPRRSPDGTRLAYLEGRPGRSQVVLLSLADQGRTAVTGPGLRPATLAWSPDGAVLYYACLKDRQLHRYTVASGRDEPITSGTFAKLFPTPAADGEHLLFCEATKAGESFQLGGRFVLRWMTLATGECVTLSISPPPKYLSAVSPALWQPPRPARADAAAPMSTPSPLPQGEVVPGATAPQEPRPAAAVEHPEEERP